METLLHYPETRALQKAETTVDCLVFVFPYVKPDFGS